MNDRCMEGIDIQKGNGCMVNMDMWKWNIRIIYHAIYLSFIKTLGQIANFHYPQNLMGKTKV